MRFCMKPDDEMRKLDRDYGFRVYKTKSRFYKPIFELIGIITSIIVVLLIIWAAKR